MSDRGERRAIDRFKKRFYVYHCSDGLCRDGAEGDMRVFKVAPPASPEELVSPHCPEMLIGVYRLERIEKLTYMNRVAVEVVADGYGEDEPDPGTDGETARL